MSKNIRSELWVELEPGLDALIVPNGMLLRLSSLRHECIEYIPGNVPQLVKWIRKNKDDGLLWVKIEEETFGATLPPGLLIKSESEVSESLKFVPMEQEVARIWLRNLVSDKEK